MFEGIPSLAIVRVSLIRGNIDIVDVYDHTFKIYAASEAVIRSIVVDEIYVASEGWLD